MLNRFLKDHHEKLYQTLRPLMENFRDVDATIVGTYPIDINISSSDIDIIMSCNDLNDLRSRLIEGFSDYKAFKVKLEEVLIASFICEGLVIEIYADNKPIESFNSYRHLVIEEKLLILLGDEFRSRVIALKEAGIKTEPAFARLLKLSGDPYDALLRLEGMRDQDLKNLYIQAGD